MDLDELEPRKRRQYEIGGDLSELSVAELRELVAALHAEITRIEGAISVKESSRSAADKAFKA